MKSLLVFSTLAVLFCCPAFAQDCQLAMDSQIAKLKSQGDTIAADLAVPGADIDRLVIDIDANGIYFLASKGGCVVGPSPLIDLRPTAEPAKPKLQGSGLEIGA